jgi:hypothetical protein
MKISGFTAVVSTLLLTACASVRVGDQGYQSLVFNLDPRSPNISIRGDGPVIDQEPIILTGLDFPGDKITITWALPWTSDYEFNKDDGIKIDAYTDPVKGTGPVPKNLDCGRVTERLFQCSYDKKAATGNKYKYSVHVQVKTTEKGTTTTRSLEKLDPSIWN